MRGGIELDTPYDGDFFKLLDETRFTLFSIGIDPKCKKYAVLKFNNTNGLQINDFNEKIDLKNKTFSEIAGGVKF